MRLRDLEAGSAHTGKLPKGCTLCRQGAKLVLLVTGRCGSGCFYCPLSRGKKGKKVVYADEMKVSSDEDVLLEAKLIKAKGTGITGGDPLQEMSLVCHYIRLVKKSFGPEHHVHLYTSTIDRKAYLRLQRCGLDELRIHPPLKHWQHMERTGLEEAVKGLRMNVGIEVPSLPGRGEELKALVRFAERIGLDFVNLNELEFSETNYRALKRRGIEIKDDVSSAAKGSEELAGRVLALDVRLPVHYCSSSFKDSVQLRRRIMRRAKSIARPGDLITGEGTLLKGTIETGRITEAERLLRDQYDVPKKLIFHDRQKRRLEVAPWVLEEISSELPYDSYLVEEYPTADRLEVERERLPGKEERGKGRPRPR